MRLIVGFPGRRSRDDSPATGADQVASHPGGTSQFSCRALGAERVASPPGRTSQFSCRALGAERVASPPERTSQFSCRALGAERVFSRFDSPSYKVTRGGSPIPKPAIGATASDSTAIAVWSRVRLEPPFDSTASSTQAALLPATRAAAAFGYSTVHHEGSSSNRRSAKLKYRSAPRTRWSSIGIPKRRPQAAKRDVNSRSSRLGVSSPLG